MKTKRKVQGFTLIELMVVITIIAILASASMPVYKTMQERAKISNDSNNIRQIVLACKSYASDNEGLYPSFKPAEDGGGGGEEEGGELSTSTDAFNVLLDGKYSDSEAIFWIQTRNPDKMRPPREDGELESEEVSYTYVKGQTDTSYSGSPLVADEQESPGTYGQWHPWLASKKAVIGYSGGQVKVEKLDSDQEGAVVKDNGGIEIFQERGGNDEGEAQGRLDTTQDSVLNP